MKLMFRLGVSAVVLGLLATYMMASGTWEGAVLKPIAAAFGNDRASSFDSAVRDGIGKSEAFVSDAREASLPDLIDQLGEIDLPSSDRIPKYERDRFGSGWQSNLDGCSTREVVLMRDLSNVTMRDDRKCKVASGTLAPDPYTGKVIKFDSQKDPMAVQIDHIVPLAAAWQMGASKWTQNERVLFSNDTLNLVASDGPENNRKSDKTPSRWMPPNTSYTCTFASKYVQVTEKYDLTLAAADAAALQKVLEQC